MLTEGTWKNKQQGLPYGGCLHTGSIVSSLCLVPSRATLEAFPQGEDPVNKQEGCAVAPVTANMLSLFVCNAILTVH